MHLVSFEVQGESELYKICLIIIHHHSTQIILEAREYKMHLKCDYTEKNEAVDFCAAFVNSFYEMLIFPVRNMILFLVIFLFTINEVEQ